MPELIAAFPVLTHFSLYGVLIGISFTLSLWLVEYVLTRENPQNQLSDWKWIIGAGLVALLGMVGARLYHLATDWHLYAGQPWTTWFATWNGGLGIYGGIIGGALGLWIWKRCCARSIGWLQLLDAVAIALPLSQAIGRLGNYFNQELFGLPTSAPWGIFIEPAFRPTEFAEFTHFHPLFAYEALPNALLFLGLIGVWRWSQKNKELPFFALGSGFYAGLYALSYGVTRFSLDFLRWDLQRTALLTTSQCFSIGLTMVGVGLLWQMSRSVSFFTAPPPSISPKSNKKKTKKAKKLAAILFIFSLFSIIQITQPLQAQVRSELDLRVQPSVVELSIQPGKQVTQAFEISNAGSTDLEATVSLRDFTSDNMSGTPVLLETNTFPYATLQNANVSLGQPFPLPADSSQQVVLSLDIPVEAVQRDWYFVLLVETSASADAVLGATQAQTTGTVAANVLVRVTSTEFLPTDWQLSLSGIPKIMDSLQNVTISPRVTNRSSSLAVPDMTILVLDWRGNIVYEEDALTDRVLAKSSRVLTAGKQRADDPRSYEPVPFQFDPLFAFGPYTVRATLRNAEGGPIIVEKGVLALPISASVGVGVFVVALLALRAYRRRPSTTQESGEPH